MLERALGVRMLQTSVGWASSDYGGSGRYADAWGTGWRPVPDETTFGTPYASLRN